MSLIDALSGEPLPCEERDRCLNGSESQQEVENFCYDCRFALKFPGRSNHWRPLKKGEKHPRVVAEKKQKKLVEIQAKQAHKRNRDRGKMRVLSLASRAEKQTERKIIQATRNSGRSNKDGDHVLAGRITLDTKLQTGRVNPVVLVAEVEKVREDARRAGNPIGALVLRNQNGDGFVVLAEEDFALLVKGLQ